MAHCSRCLMGGRKTKKTRGKSSRGSKRGGYQYKTPTKTRKTKTKTHKTKTKTRKTKTRKI